MISDQSDNKETSNNYKEFNLSKTRRGIEVRCSACKELLDTVDKMQTVSYRSGMYLQHKCKTAGSDRNAG
jgi:hypothetical protein